MRITIQNLGALEWAEFSLADLTIICGKNNTGKTYATYALFGFLSFWREAFTIDVPRADAERLLNEGTVKIDLTRYRKDAAAIVARSCVEYAQRLPVVFAAPAERFKNSQFKICLEDAPLKIRPTFERRMKAAKGDLFVLSKADESEELVATLLIEKQHFQLPSDVIRHVIADSVKEILFDALFPNPFIASAERTGAAIFRKELDFARNRLLEEMGQGNSRNLSPFELLTKEYQDYALPVKRNVDFVRKLESLAKESSFISRDYPEILSEFEDIIGGTYTVTRDDELYFVPKGKKVKLSMDESSSAVRSLLDLGFYLRHVAEHGDLLMMDEPELNLHPENQRRIARLFARLIKIGLRVFVTTHSDYLIKELNTLIMLGRKTPATNAIAESEGYRSGELLEPRQVKVYVADNSLIDTNDGGRRKRRQTLIEADVNAEYGIEAISFDETIDDMNRIQERIVWTEE